MSDEINEGVEWETVTRWRWNGVMQIELRAAMIDEVEVTVTLENDFGTAIMASRILKIDEVRAALDAIEHSAKEVECLS